MVYPGQTPRIYWNFANTQTGNIDSTYANGPSFAKYDAVGTSITLDWQINNDLKFKSITGWRQINWNIGTDLDGEPESMQEVTDSQHQHQISQEFQLNGKAVNDRLNYALGLYYFTEGGYVHDFVPFDTGYLYVLDEANDVKTDSYAAFAHLDFNVTDAWTLTAGGRYTEERKQFLGGQADLNGFTYKITGCLDPNAQAHNYIPPVPTPGPTCQQLLGFPVPGRSAALLPERLGPPGLERVYAHRGHAVPIHPGRDGLPELVEGLQVGRLDHPSVGADRDPGTRPVQS